MMLTGGLSFPVLALVGVGLGSAAWAIPDTPMVTAAAITTATIALLTILTCSPFVIQLVCAGFRMRTCWLCFSVLLLLSPLPCFGIASPTGERHHCHGLPAPSRECHRPSSSRTAASAREATRRFRS